MMRPPLTASKRASTAKLLREHFGDNCSGAGLQAPKLHSRLSCDSLRLDARLLDDRPPFVDFGLLKSGKRFGCLLFRRKGLLAQISEGSLYCRISQGFDDCGIEPRYKLLRSALRRPNPAP